MIQKVRGFFENLVYVFCRRGRASKNAVDYLNEIGIESKWVLVIFRLL